jgi:hypothetical protein
MRKEYTEQEYIAYMTSYFRYDKYTGKFYGNRYGKNYHMFGKELGAIDRYGYRKIFILGKRLLAHRLVFLLHHGKWPEPTCDHINRIRDDNRVENLRESTSREQVHNSGVYKSSLKKPSEGYYKARIYVKKNSYALGGFKTLEECREAEYVATMNFEVFGVLPRKVYAERWECGMRGISFHSTRNLYIARKLRKGKAIFYGEYKTLEEAKQALAEYLRTTVDCK